MERFIYGRTNLFKCACKLRKNTLFYCHRLQNNQFVIIFSEKPRETVVCLWIVQQRSTDKLYN